MDRVTPKQQAVVSAKLRLLAVSNQKKDYLEIVRKNPGTSLAVAVAGGLVVRHVVKKGRLPPGMLSLGLFLLKKL